MKWSVGGFLPTARFGTRSAEEDIRAYLPANDISKIRLIVFSPRDIYPMQSAV